MRTWAGWVRVRNCADGAVTSATTRPRGPRDWRVMPDQEKARQPEDLSRLFVARAHDGDAEGIAALYEPGAVMAYTPGAETTGRAVIRILWEKVLANPRRFEPDPPLPSLVSGDIALAPSVARDGT